MNNIEFVTRAVNIAEHFKTSYIWGGLGRPITKQYLDNAVAQYSRNVNFAEAARRFLGRKDAFYFDCVGLIKSILWGWDGTFTHPMGGAIYGANGVPDITADTMISMCTQTSRDFSHIIPGEVVWMPGHIGIYKGEAQAVECTPAYANGVQITNVSNIYGALIYPSRTWTMHGRLPWIDYGTGEGEDFDPVQSEIEALPDWAKETVQNLVDRDIIKGVGETLDLSRDMLRLLVILDRAGIFDKEKER